MIKEYESFTGVSAKGTLTNVKKKKEILKRLRVASYRPGVTPPPEGYKATASTVPADKYKQCADDLLNHVVMGYPVEPGYERIAFMLYPLATPLEKEDESPARYYTMVPKTDWAHLSTLEPGFDKTLRPYTVETHARHTRHIVDPATGIEYTYPLDCRRVVSLLSGGGGKKKKTTPSTDADKVVEDEEDVVDVEEDVVDEDDEEAEKEAAVAAAAVAAKKPKKKKKKEKEKEKEKETKEKEKKKNKKKKKKETVAEAEHDPMDLDLPVVQQALPPPPLSPSIPRGPPGLANFLELLKAAALRQPGDEFHAVITRNPANGDGPVNGVVTVTGPAHITPFSPPGTPQPQRAAWAAKLLDDHIVTRAIQDLVDTHDGRPKAETMALVELTRLVIGAPHRLAKQLVPTAVLEGRDKSSHQGATLAHALDNARALYDAACRHPMWSLN